jgi:hypothetical protein
MQTLACGLREHWLAIELTASTARDTQFVLAYNIDL